MQKMMIRLQLVTALALVGLPFQATAGDLSSGHGTMTLPNLPHGNDGTLPLRLPNDGTLPLRLNGAANSLLGGGQLPTHVTITQAQAQALSASQSNNLRCQLSGEDVSKHAAQGNLLVGSAAYTIRGICYDGSSRNMEIVADRAQSDGFEQSFMTGVLSSDQPQEFQGRMTIVAGAPLGGRYNFSVKAP